MPIKTRRSVRSGFRGFTLMELLLVVAIMLGLGVLQFQKMKTEADDAMVLKAGRDHGAMLEALQIYVEKQAPQYQKMLVIPDCTVIDVNTCQLDLLVLARQGLLPSGWQPFNAAIKSNYTAYIKRIPPSVVTTTPSPSDYDVEAFVRTDAPWMVGAGVNMAWSFLGAAVKHAGPLAGMVRNGRAEGLFGSWSMAASKYPGIANGQLVGVAKSIASITNKYVRLDGTLAMKGALNMGNNRINNVRDIQLLGPSSLPRSAGTSGPMVSDLAPNWILKGVFSVSDYDADQVAGSVERPVCPDSDASNGIPRILLKMNAMYNEMYGGMSFGDPSVPGDSQAQIMAKRTPAYGGWNFYALEDASANKWRVYVRRFYDNGYIPGEGLAEVYCYYP